MDNDLANSLVTFDVKGVPLSLSMVIGMPKRVINSFDSIFTTVFLHPLWHMQKLQAILKTYR